MRLTWVPVGQIAEVIPDAHDDRLVGIGGVSVGTLHALFSMRGTCILRVLACFAGVYQEDR